MVVPRPSSLLRWLRHGPFLAQVVVIRRCNLACAYCTEFDRDSAPVPFELLARRLGRLRELRAWAVCLTGGEPTLHPELAPLLEELRRLRFRRRLLVTNGTRIEREGVEEWNRAGLTDLQVSVDALRPNATTSKALELLRPRLELLARHARFRVVLSAVLGAAPPAEALAVVDHARAAGFEPRVLLVHDARGGLALGEREREEQRAVLRRVGRRAREARGYRARLLERGAAPFRCRAGARYLYVDEHGLVRWCSQAREAFAKDLFEYGPADLRRQFHAPKPCAATCTLGCARTASAYDGWRAQDGG